VELRRRTTVTAGAAVALVLAAATWQVPHFLPETGFDNSWQIALHLAAVQHLNFGRDVVFTYGPLGFLSEPLLVSTWTGTLAFVYALVAQVGFAALVFVGAARTYGRIAGAVAAFLALGLSLLLSDVPVYAALFVVVWILERESAPSSRALAPLLGVLCAFELLVKLNGGIVCLLLVALAAWRLAPRGLKAELVFLGAAFVATLVLWLASGNAIGDLPVWLGRSWRVVSGYTDAVATGSPLHHVETLYAALLVAGGAVLVALHVRRLPAARAGTLVAAAAVYTFAYLKEGFVRADFHTLYFFAAFAVGVLAFRWRTAERVPAAVLLVGAVAASVGASHSSLRRVYHPVARLRTAALEARDTVDAGARRRDVARARATARAQLALPPHDVRLLAGRTVDVVPYEVSAAWAYGLRWRGEPLLQWYTAFDAQLDRLNAAYVAAHGAERVLRQRTPVVDAKLPAFEAPATYLALVCHYRELAADGSWEVLGRVPYRCGPERRVGTQVVRAGDVVTVPKAAPDELLYARIRIARPLGARLRSFVYKPTSVPTIELGGADYRLLPATAGNPLLLRLPARAGVSPLYGGYASSDFLAVRHVPSPFTIDFFTRAVRGAARTPAPPAQPPPGLLTLSSLSVAGRRYRLAPRAFEGWVDAAAPAGRTGVVAGWAVDPRAHRPAPLVAVFAGSELVALVRPSQARPDVAQGLATPGYRRAGYSATFALPAGTPHVRVFVLGDGRASEVQYPAGYVWR
jgi:hypothetical protein